MRRIATAILLLLCVIMTQAQVDDVTLVVSGDGATKEEATNVALRSAVEQAYGVFVSANTEILNDELVKDEIATVTSGNVKSFQEINSVTLPNGNQMVTLQATVSTKKLISYAQSKGAACEFAGATFGANIKLVKLNQENTKKAFEHMLVELKALVPYMVEKKLKVGNPTAQGEVTFEVEYYSTQATRDFYEIIRSTCQALNLDKNMVTALREMKIPIHSKEICSFYSVSKKFLTLTTHEDKEDRISYNFYYEFPDLSEIINYVKYAFFIEDNLQHIFPIPSCSDIIRDNAIEDYYVYYDISDDPRTNYREKRWEWGRVGSKYPWETIGNTLTPTRYPLNVGEFLGAIRFEMTIPVNILAQISQFNIMDLNPNWDWISNDDLKEARQLFPNVKNIKMLLLVLR